MAIVSSTDGSPTMTGWKRRFSGVLLDYWRYSFSVVAPMQCSSPRQHRLQEVSRRPLRPPACADNRVQLINEQQDAPFAALDFRKLPPSKALLELAAELRAGNQAALSSEKIVLSSANPARRRADSLRQPCGE